MLKSVVYLEKHPNFVHKRCPDVTRDNYCFIINFEAMTLVSIFFSFSTKSFVRKMTLALLIAEDTHESIAVGVFSKHKKSSLF